MQLAISPRSWFLIDGLGALLSAFLLGVVWVRYPEVVGLPVPTLRLLSVFPVLYFLYDMWSYFAVRGSRPKYLKGIAGANGLYAVVSVVILLQHVSALTAWGWAYFVGELIIVLMLAFREWKVAGQA